MVAKSGDALVDDDGVRAMRAELLPRALVVTPNLPEAEILSGTPIRSLADAREAARRIHASSKCAVIVKGGHASGDDIVDLLFDGDRFTEFPTKRIHTRNTHGTGCTFASAIAAHLALGHSLHDATAKAQAYVAGAIRHGLAIGKGHGPLDHFWNCGRRRRPLKKIIRLGQGLGQGSRPYQCLLPFALCPLPFALCPLALCPPVY